MTSGITDHDKEMIALGIAADAARHPDDVCACGDYRHQHENGVGRCRLGSLCAPYLCTQFQLFRSANAEPAQPLI